MNPTSPGTNNFDGANSATPNVPIILPTPTEGCPVRSPADIAQKMDQFFALAAELLSDQSYTIAPMNCQIPADFQLSVVVPVYNEEQTIREVVGRVASIPCNKEIILVDDHSTDGTADILRELATNDHIRVFFQDTNRGKGAALKRGFAEASGQVIIVQDADLEYDPRDIPNVIEPIVKGDADVVYGSRFLEPGQDESWIHRMGNGLLTKASNFTTGLQLTDMETCYKAFRREALDGVDIEQERFGFEPEITAKLSRKSWRFAEVPITYDPRSYAEGKKIGFSDLLNAVYCILKYGFRR